MADVQRFICFLNEIAVKGDWEYPNGDDMTADAQAFLQVVKDKETALARKDAALAAADENLRLIFDEEEEHELPHNYPDIVVEARALIAAALKEEVEK